MRYEKIVSKFGNIQISKKIQHCNKKINIDLKLATVYFVIFRRFCVHSKYTNKNISFVNKIQIIKINLYNIHNLVEVCISL